MRYCNYFVVVFIALGSSTTAQELTWQKIAPLEFLSPRDEASVVATADHVIIWGGRVPKDDFDLRYPEYRYLNSGAVYDLAANCWTAMSTTGAPAGRAWHQARWTGKEMVVWGGQQDVELNDGATYDPKTDCWLRMRQESAPQARVEFAAFADEESLFVWSGVTEERSFISGSRYDFKTSTWRGMPDAPLKVGRRAIGEARFGAKLCFWGGVNGGTVLGDGLIYHSKTSTWSSIPSDEALSPRSYPGCLAVEGQLVVWGGSPDIYGRKGLADGSIYDLKSKTWTAIVAEAAPSARLEPLMARTKNGFLVWSGRIDESIQNDGGAYDFSTKTWQALPSTPTTIRYAALAETAGQKTLLAWDQTGSQGYRLDWRD